MSQYIASYCKIFKYLLDHLRGLIFITKSIILLQISLDEFLKQEALVVLCLPLSSLAPYELNRIFPLVENFVISHEGWVVKMTENSSKCFAIVNDTLLQKSKSPFQM